MKLSKRRPIRFIMILMLLVGYNTMFGQQKYRFMTPRIDSICENTLEHIRIKNSLLRQLYQIEKEKLQLEQTIDALQLHHTNILDEQEIIESELVAVNRHMDSLTPKRPEGPKPKENIINILNERLSFHGSYGLNLNQLALSNWAAGGENSAAGKAFGDFVLLDKKKHFEQKLTGSFAFGISRFADRRIEKQDDKIDLSYSLLINSSTQWNITAMAVFNTQFANGYKYPNDSTVISGFFAPAYLTLSAGYGYKTKDERFQIIFSPLAGKLTFVMNQDLADEGNFGVKKGYYDQDSIWIPGENLAAVIGVNMVINYKQPIGKNILYTTQFNGFYNYTEDRQNKLDRFDFNWENNIHFHITKFLSTILFVHLKYDHNTTFPVYETIDGEEVIVDNISKLQFKESLGIAFVHKF